MNANDLERYRKALLDLVARLRGEVAAIREAALRATASHASIGNAEAIPGDSGDMSADESQVDIAIGLHKNELLILNQADAALERIKDGTFGRCLECGQRISADRLDAIPYTPHCLDCARREQDKTRPGSSAV